MAVKIRSMAVEVDGNVVRKFDGTTTTLVLTEDQAKTLHEQLSPVLEFFKFQVNGATELH